MDALTKNLADLGTKLKDGATELAEKHDLEGKVAPLVEKAEQFAADHEEEISAAKTKAGELKAQAEQSAEKFAADHEEEISAAKAKAGELKAQAEQSAEQFAADHEEEISAAKAKAEELNAILEEKLAGGDAPPADADAAPEPSEEALPAQEATPEEEDPSRGPPASYPGDVVVESLQSEVTDIASKLEAAGRDIAEKEEVQKAIAPLLAQLAIAKQKFASRASKKEESAEEADAEATKAAASTEEAPDGAGGEPATEGGGEEDGDDGKLPSHYAANDLRYQTEKKLKESIAAAESMAKALAAKLGIKMDAEDAQPEAAAPSSEAN